MELKGHVTSILNYYNECGSSINFKVRGSDEQLYKCNYEGFLPLKENDLIHCIAEENNGCYYIKEKPLVAIPTSEKNIKKCLHKALTGSGFGHVKVEKFYTELIEKYSNESGIIKAIDEISLGENEEWFLTINTSQKNKLMKWWKKNITKRRLYLLGVNDKEIKYSYLSDIDLYDTLKTNPLLIPSINIEKAVEINKSFGRKTDKKDMTCGMIMREIKKSEQKGWSAFPSKLLLKHYPEIHIYKDYLVDKYKIVFDGDLIYNYYNYNMELEVSERINKLLEKERTTKNVSNMLPKVESPYRVFKENDIELTDEQLDALEGSLTSHVSIITGGAGCGKTTLIKQIVKNLSWKKQEFILTSFTGKAVMRLKETLGEEFEEHCITISRLIYRKKKFQKIDSFYTMIIDEASMVSTKIIHEFFSLFKHTFKLIIIGDCNQLPPIDTGFFLRELIKCRKINTYYLTINKRTRESSIIIENANNLISLERDISIPYKFQNGEGFYIIDGKLDTCKKMISGLKNKGIDDSLITILSPYNKDIPELINSHQNNYLRNSKIMSFENKKYHIGDRVMQNKNLYNDKFEIMNGEEGIIIDMSTDGLIVEFNDIKKLKYLWKINKLYHTSNEYEEDVNNRDLIIDDLTHSFAKTVHKSQGSEYEYVILYIPDNSNMFININLLYTAITRTKTTLWIICDRNSLDIATTKKLTNKNENLSSRIM